MTFYETQINLFEYKTKLIQKACPQYTLIDDLCHFYPSIE